MREVSPHISGLPVEEITNLLSRPEGMIRVHPGVPISNDHGYETIAPELHELLRNRRGGIGVFIGSGGLLSILPELNLDMALEVDKNPYVVELNKFLAEQVLTRESAEEVLAFLLSEARTPSYPVTQNICQYTEIEKILELIAAKGAAYGDYHWTQPTRFPQVQAALNRIPVVWAIADVASENFKTNLGFIAEQYSLSIPFVNFTNVHQWLGRNRRMNFLKKWPLAEDLLVIYSSHPDGKMGEWPWMSYATSLEEYLAMAHADAMD